MLKFNLVKRASGPVAGKAAESVEGNVKLPARDAVNDSKGGKSTGGEED